MPTERFYRLPDEKKNAICSAIRKEFARVPFEKASINQIIRNADISRGSFYTYFSDKQDAMKYILEMNFEKLRSLCEDTLDSNGGEYLKMLKALFEYLVGSSQNTNEMVDVVKNIFMPETPLEIMSVMLSGKDEEHHWDLSSKVNTEDFRIKSSDELQALATLGAGTVIASVLQYYQYPSKLEEIRRQFESKLDILCHGVYPCQAVQS